MQTNNKLREAMEALVDVVDAWKDHLPPVIREGELAKAIKKAEAALAEPVKNCEVGTAEQQLERFKHQCFENHTGRCSPHCRTLPAKTRQECALKWAQMPYEEGGAK